jgi:hypothetical protein
MSGLAYFADTSLEVVLEPPDASEAVCQQQETEVHTDGIAGRLAGSATSGFFHTAPDNKTVARPIYLEFP